MYVFQKLLYLCECYIKYVELLCNTNDNIRAGVKFDAGGGAETSFPLTVALIINTVFTLFYNTDYFVFRILTHVH